MRSSWNPSLLPLFKKKKTRDNMLSIFVKKGDEIRNRYGVFKHDDMIGKEYGSKVRDSF